MDKETVLKRLMDQYDIFLPNPTPFAKGAVEYEYHKTLDDLAAIGLTVTNRDDTERIRQLARELRDDLLVADDTFGNDMLVNKEWAAGLIEAALDDQDNKQPSEEL